ncbi:MAG: (Na+)-NQR maturation NqrM [Rhizobiaceae bacterium]|nr:(Na+)-NQR maturation NqrM [Rhizobiaceae bacterium]
MSGWVATILLTLGLFLLGMSGLAAGVAFGRRPIAGSCGGLACGKREGCGVCGRETPP